MVAIGEPTYTNTFISKLSFHKANIILDSSTTFLWYGQNKKMNSKSLWKISAQNFTQQNAILIYRPTSKYNNFCNIIIIISVI